MLKFLNNAKTIIRQGKEICKLIDENNDLKVDLAIQKSVKKQFAEELNQTLKKLNASNRTKYDIKYILETEQNKLTAYRKIKDVIYSDQTNR